MTSFFQGTSGDDNFAGTSGGDVFDLSQGGDDVAAGAGGNDVFNMGAALTPADQIDGGSGNDTVYLKGNYNLTFSPTTMVGVEQLILTRGFDYTLVLDNATIASGATLTVSANGLGAGNGLTLDASAVIAGNLTATGGDGNDAITGGAGADTLVGGLGDNVLNGGAGNDSLLGGQDLNVLNGGAGNDKLTSQSASDTLDGGGGKDTAIILRADAIGDLFFDMIDTGSVTTLIGDGVTVVNVESLHLQGGAGDDVFITGDGKDVVDGGDGQNTISTGGGKDSLTGSGPNNSLDGGAGSDTISYAGTGGTLLGGKGADVLHYDAPAAPGTLDGGSGKDTAFLTLSSTFVGTISLDVSHPSSTAALLLNGIASGLTVTGVEDFSIALHLATGATADVVTGAGDDLIKGGRENDTLEGGAGNDVLRGGGGHDTLIGGAGADDLFGGGIDTFVYHDVSESTGAGYDTIVHFKEGQDSIDMPFAVQGLDPLLNAGSLSQASFDSDLTSIVGAAQLKVGHAVLLKPSGGDLAGDLFLIVDANGTAGYQAEQDFVIEMNPATITTVHFI
jgi:Ca2+-binding RTX toxin-like protein